jgi:hypothetical protein
LLGQNGGDDHKGESDGEEPEAAGAIPTEIENSEAAQDTQKYLMLQKKRMSKMKMEIQGLLGGGGSGGKSKFEAFDCHDESLSK